MLLKDLVLFSLETYDKTHIDYGKYTKPLTEEMYLVLADYEVEKFYLDIKDNTSIMVVKLVDY